jgi:hypothetical protein
LINKDIIEFSSIDLELSQKETKWITQAVTFKTDGKVELKNYVLPQFTNKRKITSEIHMFEKNRADTYDLIIGRDILSKIGLNILYDTHQFEWNDIKVKMIPRGYWNRANISSLWRTHKANQHEEANLTVIKPEEYKVTDIAEVLNAQQHLSLAERIKLTSMQRRN